MLVDSTQEFPHQLLAARQEFAGVSDRFDGDHRSAAQVKVDLRMWYEHPAYVSAMVLELLRIERDMVYATVVASTSEWTAIRSRFVTQNTADNASALGVHVDAYAADKRVYVPVLTSVMPKNTHHCRWCGGHTYNDRRGNCAACGAPRTDDPSACGWLNTEP